ncbi:DUF4132 domain-containing protein [Deinococcus yavapaiensis]|uniref:Uncharacterized protein DUF4132 n=1 Tax=Deinococcus yavapaiensis KR-236 TaxID=694435 RepID=A0A318SIZ1_9DEIO|nr:DUF4132 domain-containing protein [Deinococcus yavapaiensis]PYE54155.1 uncharacterized protein DUF4132 [Deinococcus yavapaiensis KR-236]
MTAPSLLEEQSVPWEPAFEAALQDLPASQSELLHEARELFTRATLRFDPRREERVRALYEGVHALAPEDRLAVLRVLFPHFAEVADAAYRAFLTRHPYQQGYVRRAFRAPGHALHVTRAGQWLFTTWRATNSYPYPISWFAAHAGLMEARGSDQLGYLLAAALDEGDDDVFSILKQTASSEHPVARMGRHVTRALLSSRRPDAHAFARSLLLAAQRQEGLRQVILESVDEGDPAALASMLRLVLDEDLLRFSSVVRAVGTWLALAYDVTDLKLLKGVLRVFADFLDSEEAAVRALTDASVRDAYLALFALSYKDVRMAVEHARVLLESPDVERRFTGAAFLAQVGLPETSFAVERLLDDPDPRVGALVLNATRAEHFDALERFAAKLGSAERKETLLFDWLGAVPPKTAALDLLPTRLGDRPLARLVPHLGAMSTWARTQVLQLAQKRAEANELDADVRAAVLTMLQDRVGSVGEAALGVLDKLDVTDDEILALEALLTRKSANLRRGALNLLLKHDERALTSAGRLLSAKKTEPRLAGLQLALALQERGRDVSPLVRDFTPKNAGETQLYERLVTPETSATLENGLGTFDPAKLAPIPTLREVPRDYAADFRRGRDLLASLDAFVHDRHETPIEGMTWDGTTTLLLGHLRWVSSEHMPLPDEWRRWWRERPDARQGDLARMRWALQPSFDDRPHVLFGKKPDVEWQHGPLLTGIVYFLYSEFAGALDLELSLDALQTALARLDRDAKTITNSVGWLRDVRDGISDLPVDTSDFDAWPHDVFERWWNLEVYQDRAFRNLPRRRPSIRVIVTAIERGLASEHDLYDLLIGPRDQERSSRSFADLERYSGRKRDERVFQHPLIDTALQNVRRRVLDVELARGDLDTPATSAALSLRFVPGAPDALKALAGLGNLPLARGHSWGSQSKGASFSHLVRVSFPTPDDTPETFGALRAAHGLSEARLLDLAMYAPQWANLVAANLGWDGLADGVYWLHAHTKDRAWTVPEDVREAWEAEIAERTPLSAADLLEGAVDVAWFKTTYERLGEAHFETLLNSAKYASSSGGHKRAGLFQSAILGRVAEDDLLSAIHDKRHQDSVRALGLLPADDEARVEARYRVLRDFQRGAKAFGAQRQASETLAAAIGLQNLARSAGYADPRRLGWAMEARGGSDWRLSANVEDVTLQVEVDSEGLAHLKVEKNGRALKAIPSALKKTPEVIAVQATLKDLRDSRGRMREALEDAMVRGDLFAPKEVRDLARHPVIAPMLRRSLWLANEQDLGLWNGDVLTTLAGDAEIGERALRLAHPHDLFTRGEWRAWQTRLFDAGLAQPFKQVFREYYPLTAAERGASRSLRYEGHSVQPRQSLALLKGRGWIGVPDEGIRKTFHAEGLNVFLDLFVSLGTPNDVEGLPMGAVVFADRDSGKVLPLEEVPPRLFSEVMRDLDLVVSVAHVGGVDPEASRSTVEMRAAIVGEMLRLLKLDNVRLEHSHALIAGQLASYSVHLGSGVVHLMPGGALCVVPVHNQQQGRIFLPFADPDPKTAEVTSKVLLFARDKQIQDPTILEQLA